MTRKPWWIEDAEHDALVDATLKHDPARGASVRGLAMVYAGRRKTDAVRRWMIDHRWRERLAPFRPDRPDDSLAPLAAELMGNLPKHEWEQLHLRARGLRDKHAVAATVSRTAAHHHNKRSREALREALETREGRC